MTKGVVGLSQTLLMQEDLGLYNHSLSHKVHKMKILSLFIHLMLFKKSLLKVVHAICVLYSKSSEALR